MNDTIVARVQQVSRQLDTLTDLQKAQNEANNINDTLVALDEASAVVAAVTTGFLFLRDRLTPERAGQIEESLSTLTQSVRASADSFAQDRRQARQLRPIRSQAQQILTTLGAAWRESADARARPLLQLLSLVQRLPEMQAQQATAAQLATRLRERAERLPQSVAQVREFDTFCDQLEALLKDMRGLNAPVKTFLQLVVDGKATINDLSDEALAWCRQGSRSTTFRIVFPAETGE